MIGLAGTALAVLAAALWVLLSAGPVGARLPTRLLALGAGGLHALGLGLLFASRGGLPTARIDVAALSGLVVAALAVGFEWTGRAGVRRPLATVSGLSLVAALAVPAQIPADTAAGGLTVTLAVLTAIAVGLVLAAGAVAFQRLVDEPSGAQTALGVAAAAGMLVAVSPWGAQRGDLPLEVTADGAALHTVSALVTVQARDTGEAWTHAIPALAGPSWVAALEQWTTWGLLALLLAWLVHFAAGTPTFRKILLVGIGLGGGLAALRFAAMAIATLTGFGVDVTEASMAAWIEGAVLPFTLPAQVLQSVAFEVPGPYRLCPASAPWSVTLFGAVAVMIGAAGARTARQLLGRPTSADAAEIATLERAETALVGVGLGAWAVATVMGVAFSELTGAGLIGGDPALALRWSVLAGFCAYYGSQHLLRDRPALPSLVALGLAAGAVILVFGPPLGWTLPSAFPS
jgi:hypothetical protein